MLVLLLGRDLSLSVASHRVKLFWFWRDFAVYLIVDADPAQ